MQIWIETFVKRTTDFNSDQCLIRFCVVVNVGPDLAKQNLINNSFYFSANPKTTIKIRLFRKISPGLTCMGIPTGMGIWDGLIGDYVGIFEQM